MKKTPGKLRGNSQTPLCGKTSVRDLLGPVNGLGGFFMPDPEQTIFVEDETLRQGFTQIPNAILRRSDLSPGAKLSYVMLLSYAWHKDSCFPGQDTLAEDMAVSTRSVITYLKELQQVGLLIVKRRGLGLTNLYFLPKYNTRSENLALPEVQETTSQEVQNLQTKNMNMKNTQIKKGDSKFRRVIQPYIEDIARELADEAPLSSSITRASRILEGLQEDEAINLIEEARARTKEHSASIRKKKAGPAHSIFTSKNKMPYFFSVLKNLCEE